MGKFSIQEIYAPKNEEDWFLFKTKDSDVFSFRLGGIKREENINYFNYNLIKAKDYIDTCITKILTDEEWVYILLENENVIASGWTSIDFDGELSLGLQFQKLSDFELNFFDSELTEIVLEV